MKFSFDRFKDLAEQGFNAIPVWEEVLADLDTPVSCYLKVKAAFPDSPGFFLLESVEGGERLGRYSTVGCNPVGLLSIQGEKSTLKFFEKDQNFLPSLSKNPFEALQKLTEAYRAPGDQLMMAGLFGALAYDAVRYLERLPGLKLEEELPEAAFFLGGDLLVFDHLKKTIKLVTVVYLLSDDKTRLSHLFEVALTRIARLKEALKASCPATNPISLELLQSGHDHLTPWSSSFGQKDFEQAVLQTKEYIKSGEVFQLVLSQKLTQKSETPLDPLLIYRLLRSLNPTPYQFLFDFGDFQIIGSSPEMMLRCHTHEAVLRPIAGTYRRGDTPEEDERLAEELRSDPKELAEHLMLVDLARNDLGRIALPGSVKPHSLMVVEKYSHVLHLVSEIGAKPIPETNPVQILKAVFPAGTLSGAPKVRAMQLIAELEPVGRGFYAGCVGYIGFEGYSNTAMTIRTLVLSENAQKVQFQAGAGIVYDSDPGKEYQETINKGAAILKVLEQILHLKID
ncbi:MAG: chorismate-binding protein [Candidatus Caenarcaniphilales bacterium]|nr:chorismate-binding protein [Candidatus Caenarcaniphilales bacterium]